MSERIRNKKVVAWQVSEDFDGSGCIVFHHHGLAARRKGAEELDVEFDYVKCVRAPEFDGYAEQGKVPTIALLEAGWICGCHCGARVMAENCCDDGVFSEDGRKIIVDGDAVYCNQDCKDRHDSRWGK